MVTIKQINRPYERVSNEYTGASWISYPKTEQKFIQDIENLCNTIGEDKLISVQFLNGEKNQICCCIITYKELSKKELVKRLHDSNVSEEQKNLLMEDLYKGIEIRSND